MELYTAPPGEAWRLGQGPFIFAGRPPLLVGQLELLSATEEKMKVRGIAMTGGEDSQRLRAYGMDVVRTAARLNPGERARVGGHLVVDPSTPPGIYRNELMCGEQREDAVIHVFPNEDVRLVPSPWRIAAKAGEVVSRVVIVTNRGNVPQPIQTVALIFLEERNWVNRSLVFALRETAEDEGYQRYLDRVLKEVRGSLLSPVRIKVGADNEDLQPGKTKEVSIELRLPTEMAKGRVYFGSTTLIGGKLGLEVKCTGQSRAGRRSVKR